MSELVYEVNSEVNVDRSYFPAISICEAPHNFVMVDLLLAAVIEKSIALVDVWGTIEGLLQSSID